MADQDPTAPGSAATPATDWVLPDVGADQPGPSANPPPMPSARQPDPVVLPAPFRRLTLSDIVDGAFATMKLRPRTVIGFTTAVVAPIQFLAAWMSRDQLGDTFQISADASFGSVFSDANIDGTDLLFTYVGLIPYLIVGAFVGRLLSAWYGGEDPTTRELVAAVARATPALLVAFVVVHLAETAAIFGVIAPIFVVPLFMLVGPVIAVEGLGPFAGVGRAVKLVGRRYLPTVSLMLLVAFISFVLSIAFGLLPSLIADIMGPGTGWIVLAVGQVVTTVVTTAFVAGASSLHYLDIRVRTEGLDLELKAARAFGSPE